MPVPETIVLYDGACPLCTQLAFWSQARVGEALVFESWQGYCKKNPANQTTFCHGECPEQLVVLRGDAALKGDAAWAYLLSEHPSLRELRWLAEKLGYETFVARRLGQTANWLKGFCRTCPKPFLKPAGKQ